MQTQKYFGVDIGGTKITVVKATKAGLPDESERFPTCVPSEAIPRIITKLKKMGANEKSLIGISCGDPLDRNKGLILSPPNLPGWDRIEIIKEIESNVGARAWLMNDANAGALAEWRHGAGERSRHMIFITAGTGFGAGLILNSTLYEGASGAAGEIGHIRLAPDGPMGYGKSGSVEGFCSGGGIAQLAQAEAAAEDGHVPFNHDKIEDITAEHAAIAAGKGDKIATALFRRVGMDYGRALAILIDLFNPERIVIGGIYSRCRGLIEPSMREVLKAEVLPRSLGVCQIEPGALDEKMGEYASLCVAQYRSGNWPKAED
ncbi:MAG: ROK family protein [Candidatus Methylacidiphilales bacterium]